MARSSAQELDFFSMEKHQNCLPSSKLCDNKPPIFDRQKSSRDIQGVISKINPEILKSVIANVNSVPSTPKETQSTINPNFSLCDPTLRLNSLCETRPEIAPMTIFYNGNVSVFEVSSRKAHDLLLKLAELDGIPNDRENLNGDLPIKRRKSLQRFLEKRAERRLTMASPYHQQPISPSPGAEDMA